MHFIFSLLIQPHRIGVKLEVETLVQPIRKVAANLWHRKSKIDDCLKKAHPWKLGTVACAK